MPTVRDFTDPFVPQYCPVPTVGPGVCDVCRGAPGTGFARCYSCAQTTGQVTHEIELVLPISLAVKTEQFYYVLKAYKGYYASEAHRLQMAGLFARFLARHRPCIVQEAGHDWDVITIVPSSGERHGPHPLEAALTRVTAIRAEYQPLLVKGTAPITHNHANDDGYAVAPDVNVAGRNVLLVDDTLTSGARVQSAASRLQLAGARVVATVVAARIMTPDFNPQSRALWDGQRAKTFDFDRCSLVP